MKKLIILASIIFLGFGTALAQSNELNTTAGAGEVMSHAGTGISFSFTLGEPVSETIRDGDVKVTLTQGFQQNLKGITALTGLEDDDPTVDADMTVYPNPTDGVIKIRLGYDNNTDVNIVLYDMRGVSLIESTQAFEGNNELQIDLGSLPAAVYVLNVATADGKVNRTFRVEKQ